MNQTGKLTRAALLAALLFVPAASLAQARDTVNAQKTFFTRRDLVTSGIALAGSAVVSHFDLRVANWARTDAVQGDQGRKDLIGKLTRINETPLTIAAAATFLIGRATGSETVTDIGLHTTEALLLNLAVSELIRGPVGRLRPRASPDDQYKFELGGGFTKFEDRSFPSLHASAAFTAASAIVGELKARNSPATKWAAPVLYTAAMVPGLTRLHLDQHWISDVAAGTFVGVLLGSRVVSYAHSHNPNRLERMLLGATIVPGDGGVKLAVSLAP